MNEQLSARLKRIREYLNLSQQEVSDHTGIPRPSVSAMENGKRGVSVEELRSLARLYGYPVSYFVEDQPLAGTDPRVEALFRATTQLSEPDKDEVLRFAEYLRFRKEAEQMK
jgi:transcriptional regulator with XRE-family HTH domain